MFVTGINSTNVSQDPKDEFVKKGWWALHVYEIEDRGLLESF